MGGRKLSAMLRELRPALQDGQWVFITAEAVPTGVRPLATFAEPEGLSLLLRREQADSLGLAYDFVGAWISLTCTPPWMRSDSLPRSLVNLPGLGSAAMSSLPAITTTCSCRTSRHVGPSR